MRGAGGRRSASRRRRATTVHPSAASTSVSPIALPPDNSPPVLLPPRKAAEPSPSIQLDDAADVRIRLLDAARGPLAGCAGYLRPADAAPFGDLASARFCTDPAGACALRPWPGDWYLFAEGKGCWLFERCSFASGRRDLELTAQPLAHCTGVLTRTGQPVADAALVLVRSVPASDEQTRMLLAFVRRPEERLRARVRTDADGRFDIPFVPVQGMVRTMRFDAAGRRSQEFTCDAAELRLELQ